MHTLDVMRQMMHLTGLNRAAIKPPPLWAQGHHLCRNTKYQETDFQQHIKSLTNETSSNFTIPYDSDCIGQSLMKTAFEVNDNRYDDETYVSLNDDFELLKRYVII